MATSGVYTITKNALQLSSKILQILNVTQVGMAATPDQVEIVKDSINLWILQQKGQPHIGRPGLMMWLKETATLTLVASQYLYELKPSGGDLDIQVPTDIIHAYLRESATTTDTQMREMTSKEYEKITNKAETGTPYTYYYEHRKDNGYFYVHYAPTSTAVSNYNIRLIYRQPIEVISSNTDELDIADFWYRTLIYNVALDVAPIFQSPISDLLMDRARESNAIMNSFYQEEAGGLIFEPYKDMEDEIQ